MIVPPFAGVALVDYRDRIEIAPYYWCRKFVGLGRRNVDEVGPSTDDDGRPFFEAMIGKGKVWVILSWRRYEDGREEPLLCEVLDTKATKAQAQKAFQKWWIFR